MPECFLIEPTETETKEAMDDFIDAMAKILEEANTNPETVTEAPFTQPVRRLDEERCAETAPPVITWLDRALEEADRASSLVNEPERVALVRRTIARRRALVLEACPIEDGFSPP